MFNVYMPESDAKEVAYWQAYEDGYWDRMCGLGLMATSALLTSYGYYQLFQWLFS